MKNFGHYLVNYDIEQCEDTTFLGNIASTEERLSVNCAGKTWAGVEHTHFNPKGRLDYYLIYIVSGRMRAYNEGEWIELTEGDVIITPPKTPYKHHLFDDDDMHYLWVHFTGNGVESILNRYKLDLFPCVHKTSSRNNIGNRFQKLFEGFARNDEYRSYDLSALLDRLLIEIARGISKNKTERISISKSIRYLNENYTSKIKIPDLAKMEKMCMTLYNKTFKEQMGMSPTAYIMKLRIDNACELLQNTDLSIKEIGVLCGYDDSNFFRKTFKKLKKIAPLEYRINISNL